MRKVNLILFAILISLSQLAAVNLVTNGGFETNTQGWFPFNNNGTQTFELDANNPIMGTNSAKITITNGTSGGAIGENWRLGTRWGMSTYKSGRYLVHFKAKASKALKIVSMFQQYFSPYASWGYIEWNLTTSVQDFNVVLDNSTGDVGGFWAFVLYYGHLTTDDQVWIDDVKIEELVNASSGIFSSGNVCNGDFETNIANINGTIQGWQKTQDSPADFTYGLETSTPISEATSFKATSVTPGDFGYKSMLSWNFNPVLGMKYTIQFKAKASTNVAISAEIWDAWNSGNRYNNLGFANFNVTTTVQTFSYDFPNSVSIYSLYNCNIWMGMLPAGQSIWIDDVKIFQTSSPILDVTSAVSTITTSTSTAGGSVLSNDRSITSKGVCWNTLPNPTTSNSKTNDGTSVGLFTSSITGLSANTGYYVRSYAINDIGTTYGTQVSFTTLANVPSAPTVNNASTTTMDVAVNANGNPISTTFAIQETSTGNYVQADGTLGVSSVWQTASSWGTRTVTGLSANTDYSFKVKAINGASVETTFSGAASLSTLSAINVNNTALASTLPNCPTCDLVVSSTGMLTIDDARAYNSVTVTPGGNLTLNSGKNITVTGAFTLQSDATGTATLVDNTTNAPQAVTATVQQYVTEGRNWYLSIPLASCASSLLNRGTSVACYDEPSGTWIAPAAGTLNKLRGYVQVATSTPSITGTTGTVDFTGVVNTGAQSFSLTRTVGKTGFNLVGNPYPSYLDWNLVTRTNVLPTLWYRAKEGSVYKFYTYIANDAAGVGSPASVTNKIPPMQAFWVRVNTEGTGSIAVDNNMRAHKDVVGNIMKAPNQTPQKLLRLQISNGLNTDETVVYFNANASDTFDQYDAQKRSNGEPSVPEIFTQVGTEQLVINGLSQVKYNTEIPIGFSTEQATNFSITANEISNFEAGTRVILIDKQNPTVETELNNGTAYNFSAPVTPATTSRFSLIFRAHGTITGIDNSAKQNVQVFVNTANQIVVASPEVAKIDVYNVMGQKLYENRLTSTKTTINKTFGAGVYFVALTINGQSEIQKVIIR